MVFVLITCGRLLLDEPLEDEDVYDDSYEVLLADDPEEDAAEAEPPVPPMPPPPPDSRMLAAPASCHSHLFCAFDHTHLPSGAEDDEDEEESSPEEEPDELPDP